MAKYGLICANDSSRGFIGNSAKLLGIRGHATLAAQKLTLPDPKIEKHSSKRCFGKDISLLRLASA